MKKICIGFVITGCLVAALFACSQKMAPRKEAGIILNNCGGKVKLTEPYICFESVLTDSRCPEDVDCIWSGVAMIQVNFHENKKVHIFQMSLPMANYQGAVKDTVINGYKITLDDLVPHPNSSKPASPAQPVKAFITITKQ